MGPIPPRQLLAMQWKGPASLGAGILAAFDDAIADGVDIITLSLGGRRPTSFDVDSIAIGSFHAMSNGILVTQSAGNSGPNLQTVASVAPWVLTVAANTIDRKFISKLELNDRTVLTVCIILRAIMSFITGLPLLRLSDFILCFEYVLQPDVSAPGVDILAAYPPDVPPTKEGGDDRRVKFNVISGTSMSCPHVAGAAAYVKTFHPDWSPSAIKSALMTTGTLLLSSQ
ncbi:hypothetical protein CRG98_048216 [Punica granatum]|uniref:Peptidase S8/S53 domain-containing protein n=1 Tax=Punica granatum TaxID=22663 RepID=A0A2I0HI81_PUNGR|nr:hypothetical protein CRG98_048216 [Punica granatum]